MSSKFAPFALATLVVLAGCAKPPPPPPAVATPVAQAPAWKPPPLPDREVSEQPFAGPPLVYPSKLQPRKGKSKVTGTATVECTVTVAGSTRDCRVINSSNPAFAPEALNFVSHSRYMTQVRNGAPEEVEHRWTIEFVPGLPTPPPDRDVPAKPVGGLPLAYPPRMLNAGREGWADVECTVTVEGATKDCRIVTADGGIAFVAASYEYVMHSRYTPALHNGAPVEALHKWTIRFKLNPTLPTPKLPPAPKAAPQ